MKHDAALIWTVTFACLVVSAPNQAAGKKPAEWDPPVSLGPSVNSPFLEQTPEMSRDGLSLYFSSNRPGGFGLGDLYVSQRHRVDDAWGAPVNLGTVINTSGNEGAPHLSRDGHHLYFTSSRPGGLGSNDIWISRRTHVHDDFAWEEPANVGTPVNGASFDAGPSRLGHEFYFGSDRLSGGAPTLDIFVAFIRGDGTAAPPSLVAELSSAGNDVRPSIRFDGEEIFLSSDRTGTLGLQDLWVSVRKSRHHPWSAPKNLGTEVNSAFNDGQPALSKDGRTLLFNSDRDQPGNLDLYAAVRRTHHGAGRNSQR